MTFGHRIGDVGYFVEPTIFTDVRDDMRIVREEIFGPVVTTIPFKDLDELARWWVNTYGGGDPSVPFGGYKQNGWGRERGEEVLELYTETKSVAVPHTPGTAGTPAAIANAVVDALRPLGVNNVALPITSVQVWGLIHR